MTQDMPPQESLLKFPCHFTIKIFGFASEEFEATALTIVHKHIPQFNDQSIKITPSKQGKYTSISLTFYVESKEQLDRVYQELSSSPHIIMVL